MFWPAHFSDQRPQVERDNGPVDQPAFDVERQDEGIINRLCINCRGEFIRPNGIAREERSASKF